MRVLVTGSTGFIGRSLTEDLVLKGFEVRCATRRREDKSAPGTTTVVVGEIGPQTCWDAALEGVEAVVHLAGVAHRRPSGSQSCRAYKCVNAGGTAALAAAAATQGVRRMVYVSSIGVNGHRSGAQPFREDDEPKPQNAYAASKLEAEVCLREIASKHQMEWCILRPPLVYGPDGPGNFRRLAQFVSRGWPLPLGAATALRSFIALDNLVSILVHTIERPQARNALFLTSDGRDVSTADFVRCIAQAMGVKARLLPVPAAVVTKVAQMLGRQQDAASLFEPLQIDSSRLADGLGWKAVVTLEEGVRRAAQCEGHGRVRM